MIDIFLVNTLKFELEGSKAIVVDLGCFKELYIEYKPMFAPISQKIKFSFYHQKSPLLFQNLTSPSKICVSTSIPVLAGINIGEGGLSKNASV